MSRDATPVLTEAEFRIMEALWNLGSGTVHDILAALPEDDSPAYTTVLSTMQILTRKGVVRYETEGRRHRYHPLIDREEARRNVVRDVVERFFGGSRTQLMHSLVDEEEVDPETQRRLKALIDQAAD